MRIGALATATGLSRDTLRFYEQRGLIQATRGANGYRTYDAQTVELLGYIRSAQRLGFSLGEITRQLPALRNCSGSSEEIVGLLMAKLAALDTRLQALQQLRQDLLAQIARERASLDGCTPVGHQPGRRHSPNPDAERLIGL